MRLLRERRGGPRGHRSGSRGIVEYRGDNAVAGQRATACRYGAHCAGPLAPTRGFGSLAPHELKGAPPGPQENMTVRDGRGGPPSLPRRGVVRPVFLERGGGPSVTGRRTVGGATSRAPTGGEQVGSTKGRPPEPIVRRGAIPSQCPVESRKKGRPRSMYVVRWGAPPLVPPRVWNLRYELRGGPPSLYRGGPSSPLSARCRPERRPPGPRFFVRGGCHFRCPHGMEQVC